MISIVPNWNPVFVHFTVELLTTAAAHGMAANWFTASASPKKAAYPRAGNAAAQELIRLCK